MRSQHLVREARRGGEERRLLGRARVVRCPPHQPGAETFTLLDDNVRGMLRCTLSLRNGAALRRFRRCLKDEIASRLQIILGRPPVEAVAYKKRGKNLAVRRVLLAVCPNGDWRAQQVQYYVGAHLESQADRDSILTHLTSGLLTALLSSRPGLYPRHRWTGCDLATDDLGIIAACHSLLSTIYRRFVHRALDPPKSSWRGGRSGPARRRGAPGVGRRLRRACRRSADDPSQDPRAN